VLLDHCRSLHYCPVIPPYCDQRVRGTPRYCSLTAITARVTLFVVPRKATQNKKENNASGDEELTRANVAESTAQTLTGDPYSSRLDDSLRLPCDWMPSFLVSKRLLNLLLLHFSSESDNVAEHVLSAGPLTASCSDRVSLRLGKRASEVVQPSILDNL
jgi:hypothetical protein